MASRFYLTLRGWRASGRVVPGSFRLPFVWPDLIPAPDTWNIYPLQSPYILLEYKYRFSFTFSLRHKRFFEHVLTLYSCRWKNIRGESKCDCNRILWINIAQAVQNDLNGRTNQKYLYTPKVVITVPVKPLIMTTLGVLEISALSRKTTLYQRIEVLFSIIITLVLGKLSIVNKKEIKIC